MDCYKLTESQQRQAKWMHDFLRTDHTDAQAAPGPT